MSSESPRVPRIADFVGEPTRDLADWKWLWQGDHPLPIESHRGLLGRLLVLGKRLLRPLVKTPQNDLWDRQRVFNLILLEHLHKVEERREEHHRRLVYLEELNGKGITEIMRHNDALFARADQKIDRYRREVRDLLGSLGAALAKVEETPAAEGAPPPTAGPAADLADLADLGHLARVREEHAYLELERRYRGTEEEIRERVAVYLPWLQNQKGTVLDLGCGRGEALALLRDHGVAARGIDSSARMVALCRERGLEAEEGDVFAALAAVPAGTLGGVVSFHVIEHLPTEALDRLVRLAYRALAPGGVLVLETPSPLSMVVAARNFWLDPTHKRPVHPESLKLLYELAGFDPVERLDLRPFPAEDRLPEIDLATVPPEQKPLADRVNRLRDALDDLLFGSQDFGMVGTKPPAV